MENDLTSQLAPVKMDPDAVIAALDKGIAETPLATRSRTGGAVLEPTVGIEDAAHIAPKQQPEIDERSAETTRPAQTNTPTPAPVTLAKQTPRPTVVNNAVLDVV